MRGVVDALKTDDDETTVELFRRIREELRPEKPRRGGEVLEQETGAQAVKDEAVLLTDLLEWLQVRLGYGMGCAETDVASELVTDAIMHEMTIAAWFKGGGGGSDMGCVSENVDVVGEEEEALRTAERLVYGWPSRNDDPTGAHGRGRFVKAFPLDFPMGIGDLYEERPRKVAPEVWVQHLLRYETGHFVGGERGQRVLWAMVNTLLLSEARARGFGIYRNVVRRVGLGLQGGCVMTKRALRDILEQEDRMRVLVGQLSTVGRDVRSTSMQWAYEGKKLDCTVKHMSWLPPWVEGGCGQVEEPVGRRFMRLEPKHGDTEAQDVVVPDEVGLGRHPSLWWTLNCKYNAAYDVQRLNVKSLSGKASLRTRDEGDKQGRFMFTRDNPDLVAYQMMLRGELHMRMVMPAIVPHSEGAPYMAMARFETGPGGNPHLHGFSVGDPGPEVKRVEADVDGADDLPPQTLLDDGRLVRRAMLRENSGIRWGYDEVKSARDALAMIKRVLAEDDAAHGMRGEREEDGDAASSGGDTDGEGARVDYVEGRSLAVMAAFVEQGFLEEVQGEGEGERSDVRYRLVPPVPAAQSEGLGLDSKEAWGRSKARVHGDLVDLGIMKPEHEEKQLQSALERQFAEFFDGVVSEWNPCFTEDGRWRYKWDEEIGAHDVDVEVEMDPLDEADWSDAERAAQEARDAVLSAEALALRDVSAREPDRVNLRGLLDKVFVSQRDTENIVDVQRVRRLVAALVNRVARHTKHGVQAPQLGVHACARGKEGCPVCRYGFPRERFPRGGKRRMCMQKGEREGQWHAKFPRNDRLCCSYEAHVLLANMGNVDWRPVLNLWAVVQYVTKYATKAPKGSRRLTEVLRDAVDEVCKYVPEGEGTDFLRRSIQKFFARSLGERDYHVYEAVQLGLQLPLVIAMMAIIGLNTSGSRPLKTASVLKGKSDDEPVHYDSRVDKFNKRLQLVRAQRARGALDVTESEIRDVSLFEFWWKYAVYKGRVKRSPRAVCLMVTPCFSADCANVEHACHEGYARAAVIAYWRHMPTKERHARIGEVLRGETVPATSYVKSVDPVCFGATDFVQPPVNAMAPQEARYLGVRDLYVKFEGVGKDDGWALALMEMLTDPMLRQWVPEWVVEQYHRANPFYQEVLTALQPKEASEQQRNRVLLKRTKKEMVKRHQRELAKEARKKARERLRGGDATPSENEAGDGLSDPASSEADVDKEADELAAKLAGSLDDDPNAEPVELFREVRPQPGGVSDGVDQDLEWLRRSATERLSAAGAAPTATDRVAGGGDSESVEGRGRDRIHGVLMNPKGYPWAEDPCNVHWSELRRLEEVREKWYGKAFVGDGADVVDPCDLDPWQKFAHDVVMDQRHCSTAPLRMMLLGSAGTGKSRTVRSFVGSRRVRVKKDFELKLVRAQISVDVTTRAIESRTRLRCQPAPDAGASSVAEMLGIAPEEVSAAAVVSESSRVRGSRVPPRGMSSAAPANPVEKVEQDMEERVRNSCLLAAPTGCASFQLKFGASTLHRVFGVPVGYCGPWKNRNDSRYYKARTRMQQAFLFVMDEMSMVGRQMMGKIEFKVRDTLRGEIKGLPATATLAGRDCVLAGDPKQANPIGDDPLYKEGAYTGKGQNKPKGSDRTPDDAWSTHKLVTMGMCVRNSFDDVCLLRQVHRYVDEKSDMPPELRDEFKRDAVKFIKVTRGMADCTWEQCEHAWLSRRNRSHLQQTPQGREELRKFDAAPLLMDGRKDRVTGEVGANKINQLRLERLSAEKRKPIVPMRAYHDKPKKGDGSNAKPEFMDSDDFRGLENELLLCEGARVLLTQNLWVEAGLMNGALGYVVGYMWPENGDPHSDDPALKTPLCVFVQFDHIDLGVDEKGRPRSFFPERSRA